MGRSCESVKELQSSLEEAQPQGPAHMSLAQVPGKMETITELEELGTEVPVRGGEVSWALSEGIICLPGPGGQTVLWSL